MVVQSRVSRNNESQMAAQHKSNESKMEQQFQSNVRGKSRILANLNTNQNWKQNNKANNKENYLDEEERVLLRNFIKKIKAELDL